MPDPQVFPQSPARVPESAGADGLPKRRADAAGVPESRRILGLRVDATDYASAAAAVLDRAEAAAGGRVCVATVHMVMEAWDDPAFRRDVNGADLVTPDGMPLVWALRRLGVPAASRVYGPTLMPRVCELAAARGVSVGFYGGAPEVLAQLCETLAARFHGLRVAFAASPPFRTPSADEDRATIDAIRASGVGVLFVGLGCPKQERWMAAHREALSCTMVGVGAAFDFLAGAKAQAPPWIQRAGLEWLFRLCREPRRLWRRYLHHNSRFVWRFAQQLAGVGSAGTAAPDGGVR